MRGRQGKISLLPRSEEDRQPSKRKPRSQFRVHRLLYHDGFVDRGEEEEEEVNELRFRFGSLSSTRRRGACWWRSSVFA